MRLYHLLIALVIFTMDQVTKAMVEASIPLHDARNIVPGLLQLTHVKNRGAAFGIFADSPSEGKLTLLVFLSILALGVVMTLLWRNQPHARRMGLGLAMILGGAVGNLFDRLVHGSVVDFVYFHLGSYFWPAFNVADAAIVVGVGLMLIDSLVGEKQRAP